MNNILFLRKEINDYEHRTPLIPSDTKILINNGFIIFIESSNTRIYSDKEYENNGCIITTKKWYDNDFKNALIIGLKELGSDINRLNNHKHLFFSHSYKNQIGSENILSSFKKSSSIIYDFEYFLNEFDKRIISFGYYAGVVGCLLGFLQFISKAKSNLNIINLKYWDSEDEIIAYIKENIDQCCFSNLNICLIGPNGNCGNGVKYVLNRLNLFDSVTTISKNDDELNVNGLINMTNFDILFNCILLDESYDKVWFDSTTIFTKNIIICDISCDYTKLNNPIKIYNNETTWKEPIYSYNDIVDIIAINNLPSLLPKNSSNYFSEKCVKLLLDYVSDKNKYWKNNENIYYDKISQIN